MLSNIFNEILNESGFNIEEPETPNMPWVTPDAVGVAMLKESDESQFTRIDRAFLEVEARVLAEGYAIDHLVKNNENLSESSQIVEREQKLVALQEAALGDYWNKFINLIKQAWAKMKAWFSNLFKSIRTSCGNVKNALKGVEKVLNPKDFSNFSYTGHEWKESNMPSTLGVNISKIGSKFKTKITATKKQLSGLNSNLANKENEDEIEKNDSSAKAATAEHITEASQKATLGELVGISGGATMEEAKDKIAESYGYNESKTINGLSWEPMVKFLREFEKDKSLTDAQKACDNNYKELIKDAESVKSEIEKSKNKVAADSKGKRTNDSRFNAAASTFQSIISANKRAISEYDQLMGYCATILQAKFGEYRSVISKAIRYKGKKED